MIINILSKHVRELVDGRILESESGPGSRFGARVSYFCFRNYLFGVDLFVTLGVYTDVLHCSRILYCQTRDFFFSLSYSTRMQ